MKTFIKTTLVLFAVLASTAVTSAQVVNSYSYVPSYQSTYPNYVVSNYAQDFEKQAYYDYLVAQYTQNQTYNPYVTNTGYYQQLNYYPNNYSYYNNGTPGYTYRSVTPSYSYSSSYNGDRPDVEVRSARDVEDDSAELRGDVDMNDARNGIVFFVYGQDEDAIEDVQRDYDEYDDVKDDEEDDDFEVEKVDSDLDDDDSYEEEVTGLEEDEEYFFVLCVEYEDDDSDERLECSDVEDFYTDDDSNNDEEPDVTTNSATSINDDSARLRGEVDMNDFDNGRVFFVWGQDEDQIEDVDNDYDTYLDVDEDGDDLQKETVDPDLDSSDDFDLEVEDLDDNTDYYFRICVQYEDDDNDDTLECGTVRDFETD